MDTAELARLREPRTFPAVSLIMPTHRHAPENKQDPTRLKSLLDEVSRLLREKRANLPRGVADEVMLSLEKAAGEVDLQHAAEGLVLLAAPGGEHHAFTLSRVAVTERVTIDTTFATRDLVAARAHDGRLWVLVLSEQPTRLFSGDGERLTEVSNALFPATLEESPATQRGPAPPRREAVLLQNDQRSRFYHQVSRNMAEMLKNDPRPIVLVGVPRSLSYLHELAPKPVAAAVVGSVEGAFEKATAAELATHLDPVLRQARTEWQQAALAELDDARSGHRMAAGLGELWELAGTGRIDHLLVEEGYLAPARELDGHLIPAGSAEGRPLADAVDELIDGVLRTDGKVSFVPDGTLAAYERVAGMLRF